MLVDDETEWKSVVIVSRASPHTHCSWLIFFFYILYMYRLVCTCIVNKLPNPSPPLTRSGYILLEVWTKPSCRVKCLAGHEIHGDCTTLLLINQSCRTGKYLCWNVAMLLQRVKWRRHSALARNVAVLVCDRWKSFAILCKNSAGTACARDDHNIFHVTIEDINLLIGPFILPPY